MSLPDFIIAIILIVLAIVFMIFIIAEILRDGKRVAKQWKEYDEDDDEKWG